MPAYRIYGLKDDGHLAGPPEVIECDTDAEIVAKAKELLNGLDIEIWDGARVVATLPFIRAKEARAHLESGQF